MHQDHNIPWQTLCHHLKLSSGHQYSDNFRAQARAYTPAEPLFMEAKHLSDQGKQMRYFAEAFSQTILEFSKSERRKHSPREDLARQISGGDKTIFTQDCIDAFESRYGTQNADSPEWWRLVYVGYRSGSLSDWQMPYFSSFAADPGPWPNLLHLSDMIIILLEFEQVESLLKLAQLSDLPWERLCSIGQSHHMGFKTAMEVALVCYIWLNVIYSFPDQRLLESDNYASCWTHHVIHKAYVSANKDHCPQCIPHLRFWDIWKSGTHISKIVQNKSLEDVHEYLRWCFKVIYLYDVFVTELEIEVDWRNEITRALNVIFAMKLEQ